MGLETETRTRGQSVLDEPKPFRSFLLLGGLIGFGFALFMAVLFMKNREPVPLRSTAATRPQPTRDIEEVRALAHDSGTPLLPSGVINESDSNKGRPTKTSPRRSKSLPMRTVTTTSEPAAQAFLHVNAIPWAEVYLDGTYIGTTPLFHIASTAGPHLLRLTNPALASNNKCTSHSAEEKSERW